MGGLPQSESTTNSNSSDDIVAVHHHMCDEDHHHEHTSVLVPGVPSAPPSAPKSSNTPPISACVIKQAGEAFDYLVTTGCKKQDTAVWRGVWLGILAGIYIGIGYALASVVAGQLPHDFRTSWKGLFNLLYGAVGLPVGLTMVVLTGADLFTSNTSYMVASMLEGRTGLYGLCKSWLVSYFANLFGALLLVWMLLAAETYVSNPMATDFVIELVYKKVHLGWGAALVRGILCNWLVNMAVFQAAMAQDLTGKFIGIFLPISTFMMLGFEHSVANMFILFMGYALQSQPTCTDTSNQLALINTHPGYCDVSVGRIVGSNLIPVTLGNIVGGAVLVAVALGVPNGRVGRGVDWLYYKVVRYNRAVTWRTWPAPRVPKALPV